MGFYFYFPPENKIVVASEIPMEVDGFEPPQEEVILVRRSIRTHRAPECLCLNVKVKEHSLRDLNEPANYQSRLVALCDGTYCTPIRDPSANYKAAMLDTKSNKWLDAMNAEMQSMQDNQVWCLVDLPPNCSIMYVVRYTRPDVAFAQKISSRFQQNPGEPYWTAVKTILKSDRFLDQVDAIELYCRKKLQSHPDNHVGIFATGLTGFGSVVEPTQHLSKIMDGVLGF
ncbi:retrotransposon protein, putative, ty1-copia subclass, partial [Tanacetum coccineum]